MSAAIVNPTPAAVAAQFTKTDFVRKKERRERAARLILGAMALLMILPLALIVGYLFLRALPVLSFDFLFKVPIRGMRAGGVWPALLGTIYLVLISLAVATPIGVLAAV
jgi:phosphate transport system permease protein